MILGKKAGKSSRSQELAFWSRGFWDKLFLICHSCRVFFPYILYTHSRLILVPTGGFDGIFLPSKLEASFPSLENSTFL